MSFSIQTNVNSLTAQENLRVNSNFQSQTIQRLTSGYRINQSGDDAAGLAIANKFRSDNSELSQGVRNANDGISTLQIIDGGMNNISKMLDRLRTLATQSASDTFTGDRSVLNQEFQSLLTEIDRQSQSIGLAQGGQFAKSLEVFIGGGRTNTGALSADNGTVTVNLTSSAVDTKSLGLKGFQVIAGSANLATGNTTVQKIVQNTANGTSGTAEFNFAGPGFSDSSRIKVSVNLEGVTDLNTLVANINAAIQNAGNSGTSQAATAFREAGIVASVHTDSTTGAKQLAFTSSSTAFQVAAGDQMANALMGNFSDATTATGYAISTTLTGGTYDATGTDAFDPTDVTVRISGAGLASPVDVKFSTATTTVADAITELTSKVNNDAELQAAGISVDAGSGSLVFTSARGESMSVEATGDTTNLLGLGSFVAGTSNAVDYTSIAGTGYDRTDVAVNGTADLAFSINGAATPSTIAINLAQGDATQGAVTGAQVSDGVVIDATNHTVAVTVDGTVRDVTLTDSIAATEAIKTGTVLAADAGITVTAASGGGLQTVSGTLDYSVAGNCDFSGTSKTFTVQVDGDTAQTVLLDADYSNVTGVAGAIAAQLSGVNVTHDANTITITSKTTGTTSSVQMGGADRAFLGFADAAAHAGGDGDNVLSFSVDGGATQTATLSAGTYTGATLLTQINTQLAGKGVSAGFAGTTAGFTSAQYGSSGALTFKSDGGTGAGTSLVFNNTNPTNAAANTLLGTVAPATAAHGTDAQTFTLADIAGEINSSATGAFVSATAADGKLSITTKTYGTAGSVQVTANNATLGLSSGAAVAGQNRSAGDIVIALNNAFSTDATMKAAGLTATQTGGAISITSSNQTYFRVNAAGSSATADIGFGVEGSTFAGLTGGGATNRASVLDASGTSYIKDALSFAALKYGNDDQAITVSGIDDSGQMQSKTITLQNDATSRAGRDIDQTVAYINQQLQESNTATLQKIVAVKDNSGGTEKINFLSSLSSFSVSTGSSANLDGVASGAADSYKSETNGAGGTVSIDSKDSAMQAVAAVADAVTKLGSAQAAVGKGQNQLQYAVGLAQSQISNFAAAESRIRDSDVAAEAANLTKAQVLQQASIAAMAQANSAPQAVLALLRG